MKIKKIGYTVLLFSFFFQINAQTKTVTKEDKAKSSKQEKLAKKEEKAKKAYAKLVNKADKKYDDYEYVDAIKAYKHIMQKKGDFDEKLLQRLANSYYLTGDLRSAEKWYGELYRLNKDQDAEYLYRYAQSLKSVGHYERADKILEKFNTKATSQNRAALVRKEKNYLEEIKFNSGRFEINDAGFNSNFSDYGGTILGNKIVFTSARDTGSIFKNNFKWTNKSFSRFYAADLLPDGTISTIEPFYKKSSGKFNESSPVFTKDGHTMYFTRNNFIDGKRGANNKKVTLLKLYKAEFIDNEWKNIKELPFNSDQYSTAHPALSLDEKTLYFASDMPGTLGESDLYKVAINADGSFGTPQNLGAGINTEGRETFPFVSGDNELYFSSDGRPGLGGLDVYVSKINEDATFDDVQNIGQPINSRQDDFAFIIDSKSRKGFFSSNRESGHGLDDIYRFIETKLLICEQILSGTVTDAESNEVLANASIAIFNDKSEFVITVVTDDKGNYAITNLKCGKTYRLKISRADYNLKDVSVNISRSKEGITEMISLNKIFVPLAAKSITTKKTVISKVNLSSMKVGADLTKLLNLPINFFDLGKATIKKTSEPQLMKVVDLLTEYPNMKLDIRSHTDSRSSSESNQILSDKRAASTKDWLVKKGISEDRLTAKGYGETQLVNKCADGVKCSEKEHMQNRRSEFIILAM